MADRIEVHAERVAVGLSWLDVVPARSQRQHGRLGDVDVVDGEVQVELLRSLSRRPGRRREVVRLLEGEALARLGLEDDPVGPVSVVGDLATHQRPVELGQREGVRAVEDDRPQPCGWGHGGLLWARGVERILAAPPAGCSPGPPPQRRCTTSPTASSRRAPSSVSTTKWPWSVTSMALPSMSSPPRSTRTERPRVAARSRHSRSEEHTSELQSLAYLVCRLLLEKK